MERGRGERGERGSRAKPGNQLVNYKNKSINIFIYSYSLLKPYINYKFKKINLYIVNYEFIKPDIQHDMKCPIYKIT